MVEPGRTSLGGRYELDGLIATGGMGQVWRGTDVLLGRPVAVKVLRSEYTGDPTFLARFRAEAQNAAALSHPHIAAVYDYGETTAADGSGETLAYLVMELVEGQPLFDLLRSSGRIDTATTLDVLGQTAAGLAEAHRAGMVHRDVKPGNIMVTPDGGVKITDFGIAFSARSVALTRTGQVLGTPQYLSPEQAEGRQATPASDVYALGLIGYECLSGHAAFDGENPVAIALKQLRDEPEPLPEDIPLPIRGLVRRALEKDPARRMTDGAAFLAAIEAVRAGRSTDPPPVTRPVRTAVRGRRHPALGSSATTTRPPARRRSRRFRVAVVLVPLLGLLAGAGIAAMVLQGLTTGDGGSSRAEAAQQRDDERSILLEAEDYVGRPADEVADELTAMGLAVQREARETDEVAPGAVAGIDPAGTALSPGDTVVLVVALAPDAGTGGAPGGAAGTAAPETPQGPASAAPSSPAPETAGAAPAASDPPAGQTPAGEAPAEEAPPEESPAGEVPAEESPAEESPAEESPAEEVPAGEVPAGEVPAGEVPAGEVPAEESPAGEVPVEEPPTEAPTGEPAEPTEEPTEPPGQAEGTQGSDAPSSAPAG